MADLFGFSVPTIFATSFVVALSGAAVPGPVLAVVIGETVRRGFWAGPAIVLGHGLLELLAVALVAVGVAAIDPGGGAVAVISVLGAVVLVWVALGLYRTAHAAGGLGVAADRVDPRGHVGGLVVAGAIVSVANPYWSL